MLENAGKNPVKIIFLKINLKNPGFWIFLKMLENAGKIRIWIKNAGKCWKNAGKIQIWIKNAGKMLEKSKMGFFSSILHNHFW
jgi:hypothetical protein